MAFSGLKFTDARVDGNGVQFSHLYRCCRRHSVQLQRLHGFTDARGDEPVLSSRDYETGSLC